MDLKESEIQKSQFLSDKQIESFQDSDARINIFEGPVRAGKSFIALLRWIEFCRSGPPGPLIICGRTDKTIKRNIIMPLQTLVGSAVRYSIGRGEVQMYNRIMYVCGANDERASAKIQGSEFAGALIDELSLMPESFFKMLLSRLSIKGAQLFGSTNPDSPYCWLKKDFIDRKHELDCKVFSYSIDDNPSLDEEYKTQLKKEYRGLWYKRYIEGLWVVAEGAVYDFFDEKEHVIHRPPGPATKYYVGIDYGTQNPCVFLLFGYNSGLYPNIWCEKEYYYDARASMRQKSDYEYAQDFIKFLDGVCPDSIFVDPSASSFKVELRRNGLRNIRDANNDVLPGIRFQGQMLTNGTYKICSCCKETIKEYSNYVWDEKASLSGDERPIKKWDHAKDCERYFLNTQFGNKINSMTEQEAKEMQERFFFKV
jgi:PBSX family phage terminase large subunit